jgi:putative DNA primase/helicase
MTHEKKSFHETVAEKLIEQLKEGTAPWQKPWEPGVAGANLPLNPTTGNRYRGINAIQLMSEGHQDPRWMTYKQAAAVDAQVRKGQKGTPIQYWKFSEDQNKTNAAGKPILDSRGEPVKETVQLERPRVFFATVFNAEQIDGLPPLQTLPPPQQAWNAVDRAEQILVASGATIQHGQHDRAFYRPSSDSIHLPAKDQFPTADNYYATALHELGHWTGHETRLNRDLGHPFGSEAYAKEELRAEIASMLLGDELGIGHDPGQHAAYVGSWIKALQDDPLEIFRAAADAEKIHGYVLGLEQRQVQTQAEEKGNAMNFSDQVRVPNTLNEETGMDIEKDRFHVILTVEHQSHDEFGDDYTFEKKYKLPDMWEDVDSAKNNINLDLDELKASFDGTIREVQILDANEQLVAATAQRNPKIWLEPLITPEAQALARERISGLHKQAAEEMRGDNFYSARGLETQATDVETQIQLGNYWTSVKTQEPTIAALDDNGRPQIQVPRSEPFEVDHPPATVKLSQSDQITANTQHSIDRTCIVGIEARAELRAEKAQKVDIDVDRLMAIADVNSFVRILNPLWREDAAATMASNARNYPDYKTILETPNPAYPGIAEQIYALAANHHGKQQTTPNDLERSATHSVELDSDAEKVAGFIAANFNLLPEKIAENTRNSDPELRAILENTDRMAAIDGLLDVLLERINRVYVSETKAVIAQTLQRDDAEEAVIAALAARALMPAGPNRDASEAMMVADFIAANLNLFPEKVAENTMQAAPPLMAVLADQVRMDELDDKVNERLSYLNKDYVTHTKALIAASLGRPGGHLIEQNPAETARQPSQALLDLKNSCDILVRMENGLNRLIAHSLDECAEWAKTDASAYMQIADPHRQHFAALVMASVGKEKPDYHSALAMEYPDLANIIDHADRMRALDQSIRIVLDDASVAVNRFVSYQGPTLEEAMHSHGLYTIADVTGTDPDAFFEHSNERLSAVFGIAPDDVSASVAHVERQELAREFVNTAEQLVMPLKQTATHAEVDDAATAAAAPTIARDNVETWTLTRLEQGAGAIARALDKASVEQVIRMVDVLEATWPLNTQNAFWQRHELPQNVYALGEQIETARDRAEQRLKDAPVVEARLELLAGKAFGRERTGDAATFAEEAESALGNYLPADWNGKVLRENEPSQRWGVFVQRDNGEYELCLNFNHEHEANEFAERLALIDAHSTISEHDKALKLACINEARVRRDPDSTDDDIRAAKEIRKKAEVAATINEIDLQRHLELDHYKQAHQDASPDLDGDAKQRTGKLLIAVPYKQKEEAKALGAKWDRTEQSWVIPAGIDPAPFEKWTQQAVQTAVVAAPASATTTDKPAVSNPVEGRVYLAVPYKNHNDAKAAGAQWDKAAKSWYAGPMADFTKLDKWKLENVPAQQGPAMTPREEFADALRSIGCVVAAGGEHPIMDGEKHRISVEGEKFSEKSGSGFYVGHMDGHPAGYMKNNRTGVDLTWKAKGYTLDPEQKALLAAEAGEKLQQREAELSKQQEQAAQRVGKELGKLVPVTTATPYMQVKGIEPHAGALTDKDGKKTYVPAADVDGKHWTTQYIREDGTKRFAKDSKKEGCFHVVGGMAELAKAPVIVIGEGYATAASLKQSLGFATVSAFDSGNLAAVAQALHQKFPDKPVVIAGDDDRHLEVTQGANPGRTKAEEAAKLVGGKLLMPIFAPGENSYPANLEPVTPDKYREHQRTGTALSDEQTAALAKMKQFTDFNDLANKSALGTEGIDRQVRALVESVIEKHQATQALSEQQQRVHDRGANQEREKEKTPQQLEVPKRHKAAKLA